MLVGFCGKLGSGKSTIANMLAKKYDFEVRSFSEPLKWVCQDLYNFTDEQLYGDLKEVVDPRIGKSPREILQWVGTDIFRLSDPNFWVNIFELNYDRDLNIIVDDVRFPNEVDLIKKLGGIVIKINGNYRNNKERESHASEIQELDYDYEIDNDGTKKELFTKVVELLTSLSYDDCGNVRDKFIEDDKFIMRKEIEQYQDYGFIILLIWFLTLAGLAGISMYSQLY